MVLVDEEERRYFKQQEIILWRKADKYKSKQERSDHMQVYESAQDQLRNQLENQHISNDSSRIAGGKKECKSSETRREWRFA